MEYNLFNGVMVLCAIIGTGAVVIAVCQLYLSIWLKSQELFTDKDFTEARGVVLSHYWQENKEWTEEDNEKKRRELVCAKMDELARLRPFISETKILETWDDPIGKCWHVLEEFVKEERQQTGWDVKWKAFEDVGQKALARVRDRGNRQIST
jgi:hypothetical protein